MRIEIIRPDGDLKREVWHFGLNVSYGYSCIYFDGYSFETKESNRHKKWIGQTIWSRLDHRGSNIEAAPLPKDVEAEMRATYRKYIDLLPIKQ